MSGLLQSLLLLVGEVLVTVLGLALVPVLAWALVVGLLLSWVAP